jgi:FKBP-type peptidyl-prolyl cis-trans isomerase 2
MRYTTILAVGFVFLIGTAAHASLPSSDRFTWEMVPDHVVTKGAKVTIAFTITVPEENEMIIGNVGEFVAGEDQLIPALQQELMGLRPGDRKHVELSPEQAFGPYDEAKTIRVPRETVPPTARSGIVYQTPEGDPFTLVWLSDETAMLDFNHPLAGKRLVVDVEVLKVERPS